MSKRSRSDAIGLGTMLAVLLVMFGLLVSEAAADNWFTAILLGIPIVPCIIGVGGLLVYALRHDPGRPSSSPAEPRLHSKSK